MVSNHRLLLIFWWFRSTEQVLVSYSMCLSDVVVITGAA